MNKSLIISMALGIVLSLGSNGVFAACPLSAAGSDCTSAVTQTVCDKCGKADCDCQKPCDCQGKCNGDCKCGDDCDCKKPCDCKKKCDCKKACNCKDDCGCKKKSKKRKCKCSKSCNE